METKERIIAEPVCNWTGIKEGKLIIAGPCSAETEEQVMQTAMMLKASGKTQVFRAGIWKPRTHPNGFEGVGTPGLSWLRNVKKETGLRVATEVGNVKHVYEALKYNIDILWIGARTTSNPFAMQEIAEALRGVDIPVLVKNPLSPDLELWIGALERTAAAGISKLGVIHRGFTNWEKSRYRNNPAWNIPIELRRRLPQIPIICDPSHICGSRQLLAEVAQQAIDLNFDGLMIETHPDPENAWSDAAQQLTPAAFDALIESLCPRRETSEDITYVVHIDDLRHQIDALDNELLDLLDKRMNCAREIGLYKKLNNVSILQSGRWTEILDRMMNSADRTKLSGEFIRAMFTEIHQESIRQQGKIMHE